MISSLQNPLVKHLVKLREDKKYRQEEGSLLIAGNKLVRELTLRAAPLKIFVEEGTDFFSEAPLYTVSHEVMKKIAGVPSPEPIAALFPLPPPSTLSGKAPLLILDAIRDPGNLGTLIRTALALHWAGIFFLPTCVDPFHEKAIRSSRGALFTLPWRSGSWEELKELKENGCFSCYVADTAGKPIDTLPAQKNLLLVLSNEAHGVSNQSSFFGEKVNIPISSEMESLNVAAAGAILMYHLRNKP